MENGRPRIINPAIEGLTDDELMHEMQRRHPGGVAIVQTVVNGQEGFRVWGWGSLMVQTGLIRTLDARSLDNLQKLGER